MLKITAVKIDETNFYVPGSEFEFEFDPEDFIHPRERGVETFLPPSLAADTVLIPVDFSLRRPLWQDKKWIEGYKEGIKINTDGFAITASIFEYYGENTADTINTLPSLNFQNPRWNGEEWVEEVFRLCCSIDEEQKYVPGSEFLNWKQETATTIYALPPSGFYHAKWLGTWDEEKQVWTGDLSWGEGLTPEEIRAVDGLPQTLDAAKAFMLHKISEEAKRQFALLNQFGGDYCAEERDTWTTKIKEAESILQNRTIESAPNLSIEAARVIGSSDPQKLLATLLVLAQKIVDKTALLNAKAFALSGIRKNKEGAVSKLTKIEDILSFPYKEGWNP